MNVRIGYTTAQDLNVDLGPPLRVHYKEDDRMTIHSTTRVADDIKDGDCKVCFALLRKYANIALDFYNYFQHGIDFLISGSTHIVRKVILHTNVVRELLFIFVLLFIQ